MTPPLGRGNNSTDPYGEGVLVDSRGTPDRNWKLAMSISINRNSQYTLRIRNDLSHINELFQINLPCLINELGLLLSQIGYWMCHYQICPSLDVDIGVVQTSVESPSGFGGWACKGRDMT